MLGTVDGLANSRCRLSDGADCWQVQVVDFKERATGKDYIQIVISVESESQKPILLGRKGSALKQLATAARIDIEDFLGPLPPCGTLWFAVLIARAMCPWLDWILSAQCRRSSATSASLQF